MNWSLVIASIVTALGSGFAILWTTRESRKAAERAQQEAHEKLTQEAVLSQQREDLKAYQQAIRDSFLRLEEDVRRAQEELATTRRELAQTRGELAQTIHLNSRYQDRVRRLEDALRDAGVPVPNGFHPSKSDNTEGDSE